MGKGGLYGKSLWCAPLLEPGNATVSYPSLACLLYTSTPEQQKELYESLKQGLSALESIAIRLEKSRIADYADLMGRPKKLLIRNFMGGIARGVGFSFGFSVLVATIIYVLNLLVGLDLPLIGDFIANLLDYVDAVRSFR